MVEITFYEPMLNRFEGSLEDKIPPQVFLTSICKLTNKLFFVYIWSLHCLYTHWELLTMRVNLLILYVHTYLVNKLDSEFWNVVRTRCNKQQFPVVIFLYVLNNVFHIITPGLTHRLQIYSMCMCMCVCYHVQPTCMYIAYYNISVSMMGNNVYTY